MNWSMDKAARRVAVALALALAAGGLLSVSDGVARVLGAVAGYADFGYVPEKCASSTRTTQTLDGGTLRVCQTDYSNTYAFFGGHYGYPLWGSEVELSLQLPDQNRSLRPFAGFGRATLDPVVPGNPVTGLSRTTAGGFATISKTAKVNQGASSYTLSYTIANISGAPLKLRPMVTLNGYGYAPSAATSAAPRTITLRDADLGGALSLSESAADGGEPIAGYTSGSWDRIDALQAPSAPALDNQLHDDGGRAVSALAWSLTTVPASGVRTVSVTVTVAQPREVLLKLRGAAPTPTSPVTIDASVSEDRAFAAGQLRFAAKGGAETSAPVDASGRASFTLPGLAGYRWVYAYFDANRNGEPDYDEAFAYGRIWTPADQPQPAPTPVNPIISAPVPVPIAAPHRFPVTALKLPFTKVFRVKRCRGKVTLQLKLGKQVLSKRSVKLDKRCRVSTTFTVNPAQTGAKTLTVVVKQGRKQKSFSLKVPPVS